MFKIDLSRLSKLCEFVDPDRVNSSSKWSWFFA